MSDPLPEPDDIRPVYDFCQGVRGKHAAKFAVSPEEPVPSWMRDAIRYDRLAWISEALKRTQELEGLLVVYLVLAFRRDPATAGREVSHLLEDSEGEAFRRISADLVGADAQSATRDLRQSLERLVEERQWLVHRSLYERFEEATPKVAGKLTARLQRLSADAAELTEELGQLVLAKFLRAGMTRNELEHKAKAVIRQWLAA